MTTPRPGDRVVTIDGDEGVVRRVYTSDYVDGVYVIIDCDGVTIDVPAEEVVTS